MQNQRNTQNYIMFCTAKLPKSISAESVNKHMIQTRQDLNTAAEIWLRNVAGLRLPSQETYSLLYNNRGERKGGKTLRHQLIIPLTAGLASVKPTLRLR